MSKVITWDVKQYLLNTHLTLISSIISVFGTVNLVLVYNKFSMLVQNF